MKKIFTAAAALVLVLGLATVVACSPKSSGDAGKDDAGDKAGVAFKWSADSDCAMCHTTQKASQSDGASLASFHSNQRCTVCHADANGLAQIHDGKGADSKTPSRLKKTDVSPQLCESCHAQSVIAAAVAECTVLTDTEGTVVNPHALPATEKHGDIRCTECHRAHTADPAISTAQDVCYGCHHMEVYECGTCHR